MTAMSTCNKCGARYPSAPAYLIHKCHCEGGMMIRDDPYGKIHTDGSRSGGQLLDDSIEAKALALLDEVRREYPIATEYTARHIALCLAIEQHELTKAAHAATIEGMLRFQEAFRQEVSDALLEYYGSYHNASGEPLERFIIPKPKPDPLVEAWIEATGNTVGMEPLNAALEARGLKIVENN